MSGATAAEVSADGRVGLASNFNHGGSLDSSSFRITGPRFRWPPRVRQVSRRALRELRTASRVREEYFRENTAVTSTC